MALDLYTAATVAAAAGLDLPSAAVLAEFTNSAEEAETIAALFESDGENGGDPE